MKTFSIDLASHEGHVACLDGECVAASRSVGRVNDAELVPLADVLLKEAGWKTTDVERVACNLGPGGFTSARNGVAFANALAHELKVPLAGYHGSALALARTRADWWFHSTKAEALFALGGGWNEPTLVGLKDLPGAVTTVAGDLLDAHKTALAALGATFPAPAALEAVLPAFLAGLSYARNTLVPWYGRGI